MCDDIHFLFCITERLSVDKANASCNHIGHTTAVTVMALVKVASGSYEQAALNLIRPLATGWTLAQR